MGKPKFRDIERLGPSQSPRHGARVVFALGHTQEGNGTAESLAGFLNNPNNNASYHYAIDNLTRVAVVDTDMASWSVLNANPRAINFCFAGSRAAWTRQQWIDNMRNGIRIAAWTIVEDAKKYPYINARAVQARPYKLGNVACVADHYFVTKVLGIGDHTDLGPNFPMDLLKADILEYLGDTAPKPAPVVNRIDECAKANAWLGKRHGTGETKTPDGKGRFAKFDGGYIYWSPTTGARAVPNRLFAEWAKLGFEAGSLGYPTAPHTKLAGGLVQAFENGVLYMRDDSDAAFFVTGVIGARWAREGYEKSTYGYPTSNEYTTPDGGVRQDFQGGTLGYHPSNAVRVGNVEVTA